MKLSHRTLVMFATLVIGLSTFLVFGLQSAERPEASDRDKDVNHGRVTIVFKSGAVLPVDYESGAIVNIDNDFTGNLPSRPKRYQYAVNGQNAFLTVDLREVAAVTIGPRLPPRANP